MIWIGIRDRPTAFMNKDIVDSSTYSVCQMMLEQWCYALVVDLGFTFDSPDLDASRSGLWCCYMYCIMAKHRTRPRAKCDWNQWVAHDANLWEWDGTPSPGNASIDSEVENPKGYSGIIFLLHGKPTSYWCCCRANEEEMPTKKDHVRVCEHERQR